MSIIIYSTEWCVPCKNAKQLLDDKNVIYKEIDIEKNDMSREDLYDVTGGRTVPQIIINEKVNELIDDGSYKCAAYHDMLIQLHI